jgi:hypothetical protein
MLFENTKQTPMCGGAMSLSLAPRGLVWRSTYYLHLTETSPLGKTTFLYYYLALQLMEEKRVFVFTEDKLFLFLKKNTIYYTSSVNGINFYQPFFDQSLDVPCLLDMDIESTQTQPKNLLTSKQFIVQATSPNPANIEWTKQKFAYITFVLNPPREDEIVEASVFYSLFLHP